MTTDADRPIATLARLFFGRGHAESGGEAVSRPRHALQAAHPARDSGAGPALVAAASPHDLGRLPHDLPEDATGLEAYPPRLDAVLPRRGAP